jgi:hypothetical protein
VRAVAAGPATRTAQPRSSEKPERSSEKTKPVKNAKAPKSGRSAGGAPEQRDRGLRELVGSGPSQVGVGRAMRARDVNRPDADELADAERDLVIVHRHWRPTEETN